MLEVSVVDARGLTPGAPSYPPGMMAPDTTGTNGGLPRESYEADVLVDVPVAAPADAVPGPREVTLHVRYQGCSEKLCFFPQEEDLRGVVSVTSAAGTPSAAPPVPAAATPGSPALSAPPAPATGCDTNAAGGVSLWGIALSLLALRRRAALARA
jgi:hypothetical protein